MGKVIMVTGGTGLVGSAIREVIEAENNADEKWVYLSSKDGDLADPADTAKIFDKYQPTHVIHLAAQVGGLFANMKHKVQFWRNNVAMNDNIFQECQRRGEARVVPFDVHLPRQDHLPHRRDDDSQRASHFSNEGYAYAKRMVDVQNRMYKSPVRVQLHPR